MLCVDRAVVDMSASFDRGSNSVLAAEAALAFKLAAAGDRRALDTRRYDLNFKIVMPRAILIAGIEHKLAVALHAKSRDLRAPVDELDALRSTVAQDHMTAAPQLE